MWQNTDVAYDVAIGGKPFIYALNDQRPYIRQTAPFKKDQFDNQAEPGEQSLTGWWIRSQSSFHHGAGIKFYDPAAGDVVSYRYTDSKNVNVWDKGQVTLLRAMNQGHNTTTVIPSTGKRPQHLRSIQWVNGSGTTVDGVLLLDGYDIDKISADGTVTHFVDYNAGVGVYPVLAMCDDGVNCYWVTNKTSGGTTKLTVIKKPLSGSAANTADETVLFQDTAIATTAIMNYVKERIIMTVDNKVYEFATTATALPSPIYTHPLSNYNFTSITESGPAIYLAGYSGIKSSIYKFTLTTTGGMPTLTAAITAAEMPVGEVVHKIYYYIGLMLIGTSKGVRAAFVLDQDGSLSYGPLIVETSQPCYDFAGRDRFVWCATGVAGEPGTIRIDLGAAIETLRYAWANDVYVSEVSGHKTTAVAFIGNTDRLAFSTDQVGSAVGYVYMEDASNRAAIGYLQTGNIRFNTLEKKHFERLIARGNYDYGSMILLTVDKDDNQFDHITYNSEVNNVEVTTEPPSAATEYVAYKFELLRDATDNTKGPTFKGYQAKALIATQRHRIMQFPVFCFDVETDRYNSVKGYEGSALARLTALEQAEEDGDILTWQDFSTNESRSVVIEQITFTRLTPPDKRFSGFGGIIEITIRTV